MKLLHIDASILADHSASRQISARIVDRLRADRSDIVVTYRDLTLAPLHHLSGGHIAVAQGMEPATTELAADIAAGTSQLDEFMDADIVVIGAPMYNFTIPSQLKAWIDRILVPGKTFSYSAEGAVGLVGDKRIIIAITRGGFYGEGTPARAMEHLETYLRTLCAFIGVTAPEFIIADGIMVGPEQRAEAIDGAMRNASALTAA